MQIDLLFTPLELKQYALTNRTAVIIDALRATSTMSVALKNGAARVITCSSIEESWQKKDALGTEALLCGERGGLIIPGFDLGNSPLEYEPAAIKQKTLIFCTTNGTKATEAALPAACILLAATINAKAAAAKSLREKYDITILCAGTENKPSLEDTLSGGLLIAELAAISADIVYNDAAFMALSLYRKHADHMEEAFLSGQHAKKLIGLGRREDILFCAQKNSVDHAPMFCPDGFFR